MKDKREKHQERIENGAIATGLGLGALGTLGYIVGGALCPACAVGAPALVALGVLSKSTRKLKK